ncbi:MAG: hypothetical protein E7374_00455 [Clostridiales bacterium]|nr:hypothetical protein [Clostridiales bacterium]
MTYQDLISRIVQLQEEGLELFNAGKSTLGKNILATHVGSYNGTQILIQGGIHAREYISTLLMIEQARFLHNNNLVTNGGIYFVFLTNPDGAEIVLDGINSVNCEITKNYLINANNGSLDFSQYKANINLVDLNTNFDANWGGGSQNVFCPATENFVGFYPESEREVRDLINFTLQVRPSLTISYHSKGNVIYYGFEGESDQNISRDTLIGEALSEETGYPLIFTENSTGGYKDWCIQKLTIPSYTIEIGDNSIPHPISEDYLPEIFARNKNVPLIALQKAIEFSQEIDFNVPFVQNSNQEVTNEFHGTSNKFSKDSIKKRRSTDWRGYCQK